MNVHTKELFEIFSRCSYNFIICYVTSCARCAELRLSTKLFSDVKLWIRRLWRLCASLMETARVTFSKGEWLKIQTVDKTFCRNHKSLYDRASLSVVAFRSHCVTYAWHRFLNNSKHNPLWSELFKAITSFNDDSHSADNQHEAIFRPIISPISRSLLVYDVHTYLSFHLTKSWWFVRHAIRKREKRNFP